MGPENLDVTDQMSSNVALPAMPSKISTTTNTEQESDKNGTSLKNEAVKIVASMQDGENAMKLGLQIQT